MVYLGLIMQNAYLCGSGLMMQNLILMHKIKNVFSKMHSDIMAFQF